jgi:hypothetical protein
VAKLANVKQGNHLAFNESSLQQKVMEARGQESDWFGRLVAHLALRGCCAFR